MAQRLLWQYTRFKQVCFIRHVFVLECVKLLKQSGIDTKACQILDVIIIYFFIIFFFNFDTTFCHRSAG